MRLEDSVTKFTEEKQKTEARVYSMMRISRNTIVDHAECIPWQQTSICSTYGNSVSMDSDLRS
jgi:hypothetical protein